MDPEDRGSGIEFARGPRGAEPRWGRRRRNGEQRRQADERASAGKLVMRGNLLCPRSLVRAGQ